MIRVYAFSSPSSSVRCRISYWTDVLFSLSNATCAFIPRHESILLCGPSGVGKSHLANALANEALKRDFQVTSRPTHRLLTELHAARANGVHARLFARLLNCDLLVLDDFGLQSLSPQAVQDLYEIITESYERGSLIITSNRAFEDGLKSSTTICSPAQPSLTSLTSLTMPTP